MVVLLPFVMLIRRTRRGSRRRSSRRRSPAGAGARAGPEPPPDPEPVAPARLPESVIVAAVVLPADPEHTGDDDRVARADGMPGHGLVLGDLGRGGDLDLDGVARGVGHVDGLAVDAGHGPERGAGAAGSPAAETAREPAGSPAPPTRRRRRPHPTRRRRCARPARRSAARARCAARGGSERSARVRQLPLLHADPRVEADGARDERAERRRATVEELAPRAARHGRLGLGPGLVADRRPSPPRAGRG